MKGFAPLPIRGDGYSQQKAIEILKTDGQFHYDSPEGVAKKERTSNINRWTGQIKYRDTLTEEMLFCSPRNRDSRTLSYTTPKGEDTKAIRWDFGYWGVMLMKEAKSKNKKWDWQIDCHVGETCCIAPPVIRKQIVSDLGEDAYERFKKRQWDDLKSLKWCLNEACRHLAKDNGVALSWVTSPSSHRLIEKLEIRIERDWAFLFGHYTW
jgi:hypothetical protein